MGCDYSMTVKQEFTEIVTEIEGLERRIEKKEKKVNRKISQFRQIEAPNLQVEEISNELCSQLARLEDLMASISAVRAESEEDSLSISNSLEEIKKVNGVPPLAKGPLRKPPVKIVEANIMQHSAGIANNKNNSVESILEDPEIMALINKNRYRLLKKPTR
jgi:hypothetical protein